MEGHQDIGKASEFTLMVHMFILRRHGPRRSSHSFVSQIYQGYKQTQTPRCLKPQPSIFVISSSAQRYGRKALAWIRITRICHLGVHAVVVPLAPNWSQSTFRAHFRQGWRWSIRKIFLPSCRPKGVLALSIRAGMMGAQFKTSYPQKNYCFLSLRAVSWMRQLGPENSQISRPLPCLYTKIPRTHIRIFFANEQK